MPSLRRTNSTPLVRASPYPMSLSLSASSAQNATTALRQRRVNSATETARRRVLADIEWWRVVDGQHEQTEDAAPEAESERDQAPNVMAPLPGSEGLAPVIDVSTPSPDNILSDRTSDGSSEVSHSFAIFRVHHVITRFPTSLGNCTLRTLRCFVSLVCWPDDAPAHAPCASRQRWVVRFFHNVVTRVIHGRPR